MRQLGTPPALTAAAVAVTNRHRQRSRPHHHQPRAVPQQAALGAVDIRLQRTVGLGHGDHADDLPVIADRRTDAATIEAGSSAALRGARAVLAAQGQVHVVPFGTVLAHRCPGVEQQHDALGVGVPVVSLVFGRPQMVAGLCRRPAGSSAQWLWPSMVFIIAQNLGQ